MLFKSLQVYPAEDREDDQETEVSLLKGKAKRGGQAREGKVLLLMSVILL